MVVARDVRAHVDVADTSTPYEALIVSYQKTIYCFCSFSSLDDQPPAIALLVMLVIEAPPTKSNINLFTLKKIKLPA